jgi:holo-[acyl-carrier protein] synthase
MIKGIGADIVDIQRIQAIIDRHGDHFLTKVFTRAEIETGSDRGEGRAQYFSGRWAAKEAFYKALPISCQSCSSWKSIQVLSKTGKGKPVIDLCSRVLSERLQQEKVKNIQLSISHEQRYCVAFVVLEE